MRTRVIVYIGVSCAVALSCIGLTCASMMAPHLFPGNRRPKAIVLMMQRDGVLAQGAVLEPLYATSSFRGGSFYVFAAQSPYETSVPPNAKAWTDLASIHDEGVLRNHLSGARAMVGLADRDATQVTADRVRWKPVSTPTSIYDVYWVQTEEEDLVVVEMR